MAESPESVALEMAKTIAAHAPGMTHLNFEQTRFINLYLECLAATKGEKQDVPAEKLIKNPAD